MDKQAAKAFLAAMRKERKRLNKEFRRGDVYGNGIKAGYEDVMSALAWAIENPDFASDAFTRMG